MRSRSIDVIRDHTGSALVEFALVLPVLMFLVLGLAQFGLIFYNYILVTNAAATGARQFSISRLDTKPYTDTVNTINNAATNLSPTITLAVTVSGTKTTCSSDTNCSTLLTNAYAENKTPPDPVSVTVSYQCTNANSIIPTSLINLTGICPLTSTIQEPVE
jgi:Flp pilus assembly protein TadG